MIISHARKFIFVKTAKTAGTSLELVLSRHCAEGDVITPLLPDEEEKRAELGGLPPQGYATPLRELPLMQRARALLRGRVYPKFTEHCPAWEIRKKLPRKIWDSYFKFTIVRHPFDQIVSGYFWSISYMKRHNRPRYFDWSDFDQYVRYHPEYMNYNWKLYTENDRPLVDFVVRYENMEDDLRAVSERIGLDHNIFEEMKAVRTKNAFRPERAAADTVLKEKHKRAISVICEREMEMFGYS